MKKSVFSLFIILSCLACNKSSNEVYLSGQIENFQGNQIVLADVSDKAGLRMPENIVIALTPDKSFEAIIELDAPAYFQLGDNTLFLSPGDRLNAVIDFADRELSFFSGKGSEANHYLKSIPHPGATGYLGLQNEHVEEDINDFIHEYMIPIADHAFSELESMKDVSDSFKQLERARIQSNVVRSIMLYTAMYLRKFVDGFNVGADRELFQETREKHISIGRDVLMEYGEGLAQADHIVLPEFRKILPFITNTSGEDLPPYESVPRIDEYRTAETLLQKYARCFTSFPTDLNPNDVLLELEEASAAMSTDLYKQLIEKSVAEYEHMKPGLPAFDLTAYDTDGNPYQLSQFKGKYIYIDFWATWCGPCIMQYPHFMALAEAFSERDDLMFLTISTDQDKDKWVQYMQDHPHDVLSLHAGRMGLEPYKIAFIPRFVMIDKDFRFIDPFAPRPSEPAAYEMLQKLFE
jgi:thiol-disulfide isomerase/thioredoxin